MGEGIQGGGQSLASLWNRTALPLERVVRDNPSIIPFATAPLSHPMYPRHGLNVHCELVLCIRTPAAGNMGLFGGTPPPGAGPGTPNASMYARYLMLLDEYQPQWSYWARLGVIPTHHPIDHFGILCSDDFRIMDDLTHQMM